MLYIKFEINDSSKYADFQNLFTHMQQTRQEDYPLENMINSEEVEEAPEYDWENMLGEDYQKVLDMWMKKTSAPKSVSTPEMKRYLKFIPDYASSFLESYISFEKQRPVNFSLETLDIFNYLEDSFEVNMDHLEKLTETLGIVEFSTGNFPFGGMERFIITLKAFHLNPIECFNGFSVYAFDWKSDFVHEAIDQPEKTTEYLSKFKA